MYDEGNVGLEPAARGVTAQDDENERQTTADGSHQDWAQPLQGGPVDGLRTWIPSACRWWMTYLN